MENQFFKDLINDILELQECRNVLINNLTIQEKDKSRIFNLLLERVCSKACVYHGMFFTKKL